MPSDDKILPPIPQPGRRQRVLESKSLETPPSDEASSNAPETSTGPVDLLDAIKIIKPEDALEVHKTVCGRQGFMTAIGAGSFTGGLRFVWRGNPRSAASWGVGGAMVGAIAGFEYCRYLRRLERASMKKIVEVHTATVREKKEQKEREEQQRRALEEAESKKRWWKPW